MITITPELSEWLENQLESKGLKVADLARLTDVSYASWWRILNGSGKGGSLKNSTVNEICQFFEIDIVQLAQISGAIVGPVIEATDHFVDWYVEQPRSRKEKVRQLAAVIGYVPPPSVLRGGGPSGKRLDVAAVRISGEIAAGKPSTLDEVAADEWKITKAQRKKAGKSAYILRVSGTSMEPGIPEGSVILMRKTTSAKSGDIVAAVVDGFVTLKRLKGRRLLSDNPAFGEIVPIEEVVIAGVFIEILNPKEEP